MYLAIVRRAREHLYLRSRSVDDGRVIKLEFEEKLEVGNQPLTLLMPQARDPAYLHVI